MAANEDKPTHPEGDSLSGSGDGNGANGAPPEWGPPFRFNPEELEQFRRELSEEELIALLRELRESGGGYQLSEFLPELKRAAGLDD
ncbi:MAG TPA: hypothetical protein VH120_00925 [Gemmataceae bacterium]|jgi:hypothetical protein|nr:hypothetical protein [Gemmataceae bacterium]